MFKPQKSFKNRNAAILVANGLGLEDDIFYYTMWKDYGDNAIFYITVKGEDRVEAREAGYKPCLGLSL